MAKPKLTVYVDAGGTTTHLIITGPENRVFKDLVVPSNFNTLTTQIQSLLRPYGRQTRMFVGIRGVWTPSERRRWVKELRPLATHVAVMSDVELAHRLVFKNKPGILLNAGTGSICFGRLLKRTARAGGLGPLLGDEGSGFWMGRQYLKKQFADTGNLEKVRSYAKSGNPVASIASLAKPVVRAAFRGNKQARELVDAAQRELLSLAKSVKTDLRWVGRAPLALAGGLFHDASFRRRFETLARAAGFQTNR